MIKIKNTENKAILKLKRENMQKLFSLQHDIDVESINLMNEQIKQETLQIKKKIDAMRHQAIKLINAESIKTFSIVRAEAQATKVLKEAEAYKIKQETLADTSVAIIKSEAEARLEVAQSKSQALIKEADAELGNSNNMEGMRRHVEKIAMNKALEKLAN